MSVCLRSLHRCSMSSAQQQSQYGWPVRGGSSENDFNLSIKEHVRNESIQPRLLYSHISSAKQLLMTTDEIKHPEGKCIILMTPSAMFFRMMHFPSCILLRDANGVTRSDHDHDHVHHVFACLGGRVRPRARRLTANGPAGGTSARATAPAERRRAKRGTPNTSHRGGVLPTAPVTHAKRFS